MKIVAYTAGMHTAVLVAVAYLFNVCWWLAVITPPDRQNAAF